VKENGFADIGERKFRHAGPSFGSKRCAALPQKASNKKKFFF
jgi:hypothetical protein